MRVPGSIDRTITEDLEDVRPAITYDTFEEAVKDVLDTLVHDIGTMLEDPPI